MKLRVRQNKEEIQHVKQQIQLNLKVNTALRQQERNGTAEPILQDFTDLFQYHVCTPTEIEISVYPLSQQRVDFSARSAINPLLFSLQFSFLHLSVDTYFNFSNIGPH